MNANVWLPTRVINPETSFLCFTPSGIASQISSTYLHMQTQHMTVDTGSMKTLLNISIGIYSTMYTPIYVQCNMWIFPNVNFWSTKFIVMILAVYTQDQLGVCTYTIFLPFHRDSLPRHSLLCASNALFQMSLDTGHMHWGRIVRRFHTPLLLSSLRRKAAEC